MKITLGVCGSLILVSAFLASHAALSNGQGALDSRQGALDLQSSEPAEIVVMCEDSEPGGRIEFQGRVFDMDGRPLPDAAVVAYNTDQTGHYAPPEQGTRVPRIKGVAVTDEHGRFRFHTVYPGGYPDRADPAHIHLTIAAPMHEIQYVTFWFEGDPRITPAVRRSMNSETVIVALQECDQGHCFEHDVHLEGN